ncbi:teichuronic acid biosynthesis [Tamilnaduibacter salinus]|nr:teichuronic acid biosynthesis [Tamilnaduibacter salinus]
MPLHNAQAYVGQAVESVIAQTYPAWELIIVDDASSDESLAAVEEYENNSRISVIKLPENSGSPAKPRNVGTERAQGRFVAFIDADDAWLPEKLEIQVEALTESGAPLGCCGYWVINDAGNRIGKLSVPQQASFSELVRHNTIGCLTAIYDRARLGKRYFPECGHEDYALWLDILSEGGKVHGVDQPLAEYRVRSGSVSSNKWRTLTYFWHIYRHRLHYGRLKSVWRCLTYAMNARNKYQHGESESLS